MDPGGEGGEMDKKRERAIDSGVGYDLLLITGSRDGKYIIQVRMYVCMDTGEKKKIIPI